MAFHVEFGRGFLDKILTWGWSSCSPPFHLEELPSVREFWILIHKNFLFLLGSSRIFYLQLEEKGPSCRMESVLYLACLAFLSCLSCRESVLCLACLAENLFFILHVLKAILHVLLQEVSLVSLVTHGQTSLSVSNRTSPWLIVLWINISRLVDSSVALENSCLPMRHFVLLLPFNQSCGPFLL